MSTQEYEHLFREHYRSMFRYAFTLLHDADDARDAVGEVWTRLLQNGTEVQDSTAEAYLKRLVHNQCVNILQHAKVEDKAKRFLPLALESTLSDEDVREREQQWESVHEYIRSDLSPQTQKILQMRYQDELSYKDMAERLGVSASAINKHLTNALSRLRKRFGNS